MYDAVLHGYALNLWYLHQQLKEVPAEMATHQPSGLQNHPLWIIGHLCLASDMALTMLGQAPACPPEWKPLFQGLSKPMNDPAKYPPLTVLVEKHTALHDKVTKAFTAAPDQVLNAPNPVAPLAASLPTVRAMLVFLMLGHEGQHLGELAAWRRAMGTEPMF